jgi:hypothetical protein
MQSMLLVTSTWGKTTTFKMIPVTVHCPYNEAIYDPENKVLALISKDKKESMHMIPKLNEFGDVVPMKIGKRNNGKDFAEERKVMETFYEYYVEDQEEIKAFVSMFAVNADKFDYAKFFEAKEVPNLLTA